MLELLQGVLGVDPLEPGFARIGVTPHRCGLRRAGGRVGTPRGPVDVAWRVDDGGWHVCGSGPADTPLVVRGPDGREETFGGGAFAVTFKV